MMKNLLLVFSLLMFTASTGTQAADKAPETFQVKFETSAGDFVVDVTRAWGPQRGRPIP